MFYASVFTIMHNNEKKKKYLKFIWKTKEGGGARREVFKHIKRAIENKKFGKHCSATIRTVRKTRKTAQNRAKQFFLSNYGRCQVLLKY